MRDMIMTLEEIKQQYPNEWVLIEFTELDEDLNPVEGTVVAHSPSHDVILAELGKETGGQIALESTGDDFLPADFGYVL
jgi:hypothetical protein